MRKYTCPDCPDDLIHTGPKTGRLPLRCPEHRANYYKRYHREYDARPEQKKRRRDYMEKRNAKIKQEKIQEFLGRVQEL